MFKLKYQWFDKINEELERRTKGCMVNGMNYAYECQDPYNDKSISAFNENNPFELNHPRKFNSKGPADCVCRPKTNVGTKKDKYGRYFKDAKTADQCNQVQGFWDDKSPNRLSKYSEGMCWTSEDNKECGKLVHKNQILPKGESVEGVDDSKEKCSANKKCTWTEMQSDKGECFANKEELQTFSVQVPPDSMPSDITDPNMQQYLYDWYSTDKAPLTGELMGKGNRCTSATNNPSKQYTAEELQKMYMVYDPENEKLLINAYGEKNVKVLNRNLIGIVDREKAMLGHPIWKKDMYMYSEDLVKSDKPPEFLPSIPQSIINMTMKKLSGNPASNSRGLMAWHSTGSGKTCTAAGVMDAFWDSNKQIVFASSINAISSNPDFKFHECAARLFPRFQQAPFNKSMSVIGEAFEERGIIFISFAKLANRIEKTEKFKSILGISSKPKNKKKKKKGGKGGEESAFIRRIAGWYNVDIDMIKVAMRQAKISGQEDFVDLDNTILIIDEVHNLFRPLPAQKKKHLLVERHIVDPTVHPKLKVVILTATPGDNVKDVMKLVNIIRDPTKPRITAPNPDNAAEIQSFKTSLMGMVSYFEMSNDLTKFPKARDNGPIVYPMSQAQFNKYVEAYNNVKETSQNYDKLAADNQLAKFWAGARKYSNMLYTFEKGLELTEFSSKLPPLLEKIALYPTHKQYVYSAFYERRGSGQGITAIAAQLQKQGYKQLTVKEAKAANVAGITLPDAKRYILAIQSEIGEEGTSSAGKSLDQLMQIYNSPANLNGNIVHVFLASQSYNEGLDLKAVRHIHIFEPLVTMASDLQTIGRARRYCSHADLPQNQWSVDIHRYFSDVPITANNSDASERLDSLKKSLEEAKAQLKATLAKEKEAKKTIKDNITHLQTNIKLYTTSSKQNNVESIDMYIYNTAQSRMRELFVVYHALKEAALDCRLLHKFHNDDSIKCT
jgi:hypothetical protein